VPVRSATAQQALDALAARLRDIRKDAELTARQIAQAAGWHESKCSRIEHARTMPSPADIRAWCTICGVPDQAADLTATLRSIDSMYVEWRRMIRSGMRRLQEAPLPLYERTRQFRIYEPGVIPGLFQTAEYARARMGRIVEFNGIPDDLDTAVAARLERQRVLRRGDHRIAVVLEEWALRSRIGSTEMMARQLAHLSQESALPAVALARLQVLNTLLLASALHQRGDGGKAEVIRYETSVLDPSAAHAALARLVPEAPRLTAPHGGPPAGTTAGDDTFATAAGKQELTAFLSAADAGEVCAAAARALSAGREAVPGPAWDLARDWADSGQLYTLAPPRPRALPGRSAPASRLSCPVRWVAGYSGGGLRWRNLLVTNDEFAAFLNEMAAAGLPNHMDGCYLLAVEMPRERGGRLHYNRYARRWAASPGFGHHPAYWVTWAGAAAYAARNGARLPTRAELLAETTRDRLAVTNCAYQAGDTVPAAEPGRSPDEVHHLAGNLQVWCGDGPDDSPEALASRWLHGAAWNTPGTPEEIRRPRARHLPGASRGVGIRLVRDGQHSAVSPEELAELLTGWIRSLSWRDRPLRDLDEALPRALAALQADR
jgi:transcriptional regulator with XRE-family HTH domain